MAKTSSPDLKRRTREHIIADLSANYVERQVLLCGYSVERVRHDYGVDLLLFTYDAEGFVESGLIFLQLKATDRVKRVASGQEIAFRLETKDVRGWIKQWQPVILVVYDAQAELAYWLHIQEYFRARPRLKRILKKQTITVRLPCANLVNPLAVGRFAEYRDEITTRAFLRLHPDE